MRKILFFLSLSLIAATHVLAQYSTTRNRSNVKYRNSYQRSICGAANTFEIRAGRIFCWGSNSVGQLGIGNAIDQDSPVQMGNDSNWICVANGETGGHVLAIKSDGTLWAWGYNNYGQLGIGNTLTQQTPVQVGNDHDWMKINRGGYNSIALKTDGTLWVWGWNAHGELGLGDTNRRLVPTQLGTANDWVSITAGAATCYAIKSDGTLWGWGLNEYGQLGIGDTFNRLSPVQIGTDNKWMSIANNSETALALKADGTLWVWGANPAGALGLGDTLKRIVPVQNGTNRDWVKMASGPQSIGLKVNGSSWGWGANGVGELGIGTILGVYNNPISLNNADYWTDVAVGTQGHTIFLKANGGFWVTGFNMWGQLGLGNTYPGYDTLQAASTPAQEWISGSTGGSHTAAIMSDGSLWAWGYNTNGQLGIGNTTEQHSPQQVGAGDTWTATACGTAFTLALQANGTLWAWGNNSSGQLGIGNNSEQHSPVQVTGAWAAMAAGDAHSLALKADGTLWAWGNNSTGQLGTGNYTAQNAPTQIGQDSTWIAIATGEGHSLGLKADGTLWAWGLNIYGQLGTGNNTIQNAPVQVGNDNHWTAISAGANHSLALKADGTLWIWGQNSAGQLGLGNYTNQNTPQQVSGSNWIAINAGAEHSIAYKADGSIWSWGDNGYGQLGLGNNTNYNTPQPVSQPAIVHIFSGPEAYHTGIIKDTRSLICLAGHNEHGQLGDGSVLDKNTFNCINECVIPGITITVSPNDSVCSNEAVTFTATTTNGGPTPGYQWFKNNLPVGSNSDTYNAGTVSNGDQVKCVLTGSAACNVYPTDTSNIIAMYVTGTVTPTITIAADLGDTICQEHTSTYMATITNGGPNPVYQWYENNLPVGTNSNTYVPQQISGHTIKCRLISSALCASPDTVMSTVHTMLIVPVTIPQVTITANPGTVITQNQSVTFTATVSNATNPQYQWRKNGSNLPGETQQTYTTTTLQNGDQIACRVRGLSECDTAISAPLVMTVWAVNVPLVTTNSEQLTVYPNPVSGILQLSYDKDLQGEMELRDIAGKLLLQAPLAHSLDMKTLASGVYMLHVVSFDKLRMTKMVVKE